MADELRKGVTIGAGNAEKAAAQNETVVETSEEETKEIIRANEDDFIQGLIAAAGFATEERQRILEPKAESSQLCTGKGLLYRRYRNAV